MTANQIRPILERLDCLEEKNDKEHDKILTLLQPLLEEKKFRDQLDQQVSKWLPRVPYIVAIVSAVLYVLITKAVMPLVMKFQG